jgi:glycosyltransferase involved in cell wall biosynthesis
MMEAASVTGPAKNLIEFARLAAQTASGAEVAILTFQRGEVEAPNPFVKAARENGLSVDIARERFAFDPGILPQLRAMVAARQPDIIQSHNVKSHFLVRLLGLYRRRRWIAFHHGYTTTDKKMEVYNQLNRWSLRAAHQVVTVCGPFSLELQRMGIPAERIAIRHNMVKPFVAPPAFEVARLREELGIPEGIPVILSVGRLSREKGHLDLIAALGRLRGRSFRLVLVGDGPERDPIEKLCAGLGLTDAVILTGRQQDVRPYYAMADVVALPSHSEGSPNVLLEAMAAGRAVVATAVGGVSEIATDGENALLVAASDSEAMASSIARLLDDEELRRRLGSSAAKIAPSYTPEAYCESLLGIYRKVLCASR